MRAPAVSFAYKLVAAFLAALLMSALIPVDALAGEASVDSAEGEVVASGLSDQSNAFANVSGESQGASVDQDAEDSPVIPMLASGLVGKPSSFISSDVALDSEPIIGSFTVDGLTFAVTDGPYVELVGVSLDWQQVTNSQEGEGSGVAPMLASGSDGVEYEAASLTVPDTVSYAGVSHIVSSIGAYAFYLSGVTSVTLPASVSDVDDRAFRSSDVASVEVAEGNPTYSSFDGALYDADQLSLLLIPEGKQGAVLLPKTAEVAEASVFSHCPLVDSISVEKDGAAFASENGLLYSSDLTTLLRVPAGATEVTIREGCTTIAAGALEACAKLTIINAPATVTSISPDVFHAIPTVSLPAASLAEEAPQLTAMVALSSTDDDLPKVIPFSIGVFLYEKADASLWQAVGCKIFSEGGHADAALSESISSVEKEPMASGLQSSLSYGVMTHRFNGNGGYIHSVACESIADSLPIVQHANDPSAIIRVRGKTIYLYGPDGSLADTLTILPREGCTFLGWGINSNAATVPISTYGDARVDQAPDVYALWNVAVKWDGNGGRWNGALDEASVKEVMVRGGTGNLFGPSGDPSPIRPGYVFQGWSTDRQGSGTPEKSVSIEHDPVTFYAQWRAIDYDLGFDTNSEPGDADCEGEPKDDQTVNVEDGPTIIEDPKRPGYVFQGWTIPNTEGTEAIDQDLVYQDETDGKWYVDASKLPDYAGEDGRVELTARWTSVISVDVPSSATFYYDLVTDQSAEAHEAALSGTTSFSSKSQVDLRICGLESKKAAEADSLFSSGADSALLSVYPAPNDKAQTVEGAQQGPAGAKPATAVDFSLDDVVLERAFMKEDADAYKIPAGDDLTLAYRLNLSDAAKLDYDKMLAMAEGDEASLASLTYCFTASYDAQCFWTTDDDGSTLSVFDIKRDAEKIAAGDAATISKYTRWMNADHRFYVKWYDRGLGEFDGGLAQGRYTTYEVRIIGLNHDDKSDGSGKAGVTFQFVDCLVAPYRMASSVTGGWKCTELRANMNPPEITKGLQIQGQDTDSIWNQTPYGLRFAIKTVDKTSYSKGVWGDYETAANPEKMFLVGVSEVYPRRASFSGNNWYYGVYFDSKFNGEGTPYAYYIQMNPLFNVVNTGGVVNPGLVKENNGLSVAGGWLSWWHRTYSPYDPGAKDRFEGVNAQAATWNMPCTVKSGVSPAFAL